MFYSQFILAKKGPLGTIWIAAHLERKLRKNQVADTDIGVSVDSILFPEVPIALRLSSHLLLGVVRIYSRKVNYLFDDCSEALLKIKQAFRSTAVDLPPEESTAPYHSITLPETFDLDDFELPDNEIFQGNFVDQHVSSREQITLQDTMDRVVYSTSQFGLDERFGDGDASQIGLDLDEELFLDRAQAQENRVVSEVDPLGSTLTKEAEPVDAHRNQIETAVANSEQNEYAQPPATPGLVEVPNQSSGQTALECDDYIKTEDHIVTESTAAESAENVSHKSDHLKDKNAADELLHKDLTHDPVATMSCENGFHFGDTQKEQGKPQGLSQLSASRLEELSAGMLPVDRFDGECVESPTCSNITCDLEDPGRQTCSSSTCVPVSGGYQGKDKVLLKPQSCNEAETANDVGESYLPGKETASNALCQPESPGRPAVIDDEVQAHQLPKNRETLDKSMADEDASSVHVHMLRPCASHIRQPDASSFGVDNQGGPPSVQSADVDHRTEGQYDGSGATVELQGEGHQKPVESDKQPDNLVYSESQLENLNKSGASDLPAPERFLSVPEALADNQNDLLVESTPEKEVLAKNDGIGVGSKPIPGKKRCFTESTLTVESINSVESFGGAKSRRTAESIPDDDDLLSSILVGRRSSALKMKPSPAFEVASTKRARTAPRPATSKRKVLVDDTMVLHGDIIRQQLTSTEDIRRVRKKAPCTRAEISMIWRQFLDDEVFIETTFIGMSEELVHLHSEAYDLSGIRISQSIENRVSSDVPNECSVRPNVAVETRIDETSAPATAGIDLQFLSAEAANQTDGLLFEDHAAGDMPQPLQDEAAKERMEMEIDRGDAEAVDAKNDTAQKAFEILISTDHITCGIGDGTANEKLDISDVPQSDDALYGAVDKNLGNQSEDASVLDMSNYRTADHMELLEHDKEAVVVEPELKSRDAYVENASIQDVEQSCSIPIENGSNFLEAENADIGSVHNGDQTIGEMRNKKLGVLNEEAVESEKIVLSGKNPFIVGSEGPQDSAHSAELDARLESTKLNVEPVSATVDVNDMANINIYESSLVNNHGGFGDLQAANDTEFLNVDDDELGEDDDDGTYAEENRLLENSGWSSRTRAVAKYLQNLFDNEGVQGRKVLAMDNLLVGKTRKEASRMFFETLVLKTKDYIHVEQAKPFDNLCIKPRTRLVKSDF